MKTSHTSARHGFFNFKHFRINGIFKLASGNYFYARAKNSWGEMILRKKGYHSVWGLFGTFYRKQYGEIK